MTYINEVAVVKSVLPDATFQYNDDSDRYAKKNLAGDYEFVVMKFENPVTLLGAGSTQLLRLSDLFAIDSTGQLPSGQRGVTQVIVGPHYILEDFDCSTITYNGLIALTATAFIPAHIVDSTNLVGDAGFFAEIVKGNAISPYAPWVIAPTSPSPLMYGIYIRCETTWTANWTSGTGQALIRPDEISDPPGSYLLEV